MKMSRGNMKKIFITEKQELALIKEAMQEGFSLATLDSITDLKERIAYCNEFLGEALGAGVSRITFEIGEGEVIKLIKLKEDVEQNQTEFDNYEFIKEHYPNLLPLYPKFFLHADDYSWITCEQVIPFEFTDCEKILGLPYNGKLWRIAAKNMNTLPKEDNYEEYSREQYPLDEDIDPSFMGFIRWATNKKQPNEKEKEFYSTLMEKEEWFRVFYDYLKMLDDNDIHKDNLGITLRDNKPWIVIIDSGYDEITR